MLWYWVCILFCAYCISLLLEERFELTYAPVDQNEAFHYLDCFDLRRVANYQRPETEVDLEQLNRDVFDYLVQLRRKKEATRASVLGKREHIETDPELFNRTFLAPLRSREYLIYHGHFCFIRSKKLSHSYIGQFFFTYKFFAFKRDNYEFSNLVTPGLNVQRLIVVYDHPYAGCTLNYSKFLCLHRCFKERYRLSKYYFEGHETGRIRTAFDEHAEPEKQVESHELACFGRCPKNSCKFVYFRFSFSSELSNQTVMRASPVISTADFYLQLTGLVSFFINISICQFLLLFIKLPLLNFRMSKKLKHLLRILKKLLLLTVFGFCLVLYIERRADYVEQLNRPLKKEMTANLLEPEHLSLVICVDVEYIFQGEEKIIYVALPRNETFAELERITDIAFNLTVKRIYLGFFNKQVQIRWILKRNVLFKSDADLARCFEVAVYPTEPKYQSLLSISKLVVEPKPNHPDYSVHLLPDGERFNSKSFAFSQRSNFVKKIIRRSERSANCVNYERAYRHLNCNSKENCLDRCFHRKFSERHKSIATGMLAWKGSMGRAIDKEFFTEADWSRYRLNSDRKTHDAISGECWAEFREVSCEEVRFERAETIYHDRLKSSTTQIDLYYEITGQIEEEPSRSKLLFDMLSIQSTLFGLNAWKLAVTLYGLLKIRINRRLFFAGVRLGFMAVAVYHLTCIFDNLVNAPLAHSQHFETTHQFEMPEVVFCLQINQSLIDRSRKLTGDYLDEMTGELNIATLFKRIEYLNLSSKWNEFDLNSTNEDGFTVETTFFVDKKCFKLMNPVVFKRYHFRFQDTTEVLRVFFHQHLFERRPTVYFFTSVMNSMQTSKVTELHLKLNARSSRIFLIRQVFFHVRHEDKFNLFRNPLSFFEENSPNDADRYINKLVKSFWKSHHRTTLNLPIEQKLFHYEIDDEAFDRFYSEMQRQIDRSQTISPNYQRIFAKNYMNIVLKNEYAIQNRAGYRSSEVPDFSFSVIFFKKVIVSTQPDNYVRLILNCLNVLFIWFDIGVLDLYAHLHWHLRKIKSLVWG